MTSYLFRSPRNHGVFLSANDPAYRYTTFCGDCDYPIEAAEPRCPRCQKHLTDCPACSTRTRRRAVKSSPTADGKIQCTVCSAIRYPIGHIPVLDMVGSFCTNLYGCPAGGMLTRHDEAVLWPPEAKACPICRSPSLTPKPARTFSHLVRRCLFCNLVFGLDSSWRTRLAEGIDRIFQTPSITKTEAACILCGRNDQRAKDGTVRILLRDPYMTDTSSQRTITEEQYLRVAELGHALIIFADQDRRAADHLFDLWTHPTFPEPGKSEAPTGYTVDQAVEHLIRGTVDAKVREELQRSAARFVETWEGFHLGLNHRLAPQPQTSRRMCEEDR